MSERFSVRSALSFVVPVEGDKSRKETKAKDYFISFKEPAARKIRQP